MTSRDNQNDPARQPRLFSPLVLAISYVVYASLWILTSDWLLGLFVPAEQLARISSIKGLVYVAVTGLLLYLLLNWLVSDQSSGRRLSSVPPGGHKRRSGQLLFFLANLLTVGVVTSGAYLLQAPQSIESAQARMADVAAARADYLDSWLDERTSDALVIQSSQSLRQAVEVLTGSTQDTSATARALKEVVSVFDALRRAYDYTGVTLLDASGSAPLINRGITHWPDALEAGVDQASDGDVVELPPDLYSDQQAHLDWLIPISNEDGLIAHVLLHADVPAIPASASHKQATTHLAYSGEDAALYLDQVANDPWVTLAWDQNALRPADFVGGASPRRIDGPGIGGQSVVGAVHPLADRGWAVVATQPRAVVLQPLYQTLWLMAGVAFFLLAIIAVVLTLLWRRTRESDELRWAARTAGQDRLLRVFYDMPFFGMAITSASDHCILEANARLADMLGHPGESLVGKSWAALLDGARHDDERQAMDDLLAGRSDHCPQEYSLKLPDGRNAYLRFDTRLIRSEDGEAERLVSIAEDVTGEREAYRALENQKDLYNLLSQTNQAITRCRSADELFETACRVAVEYGHLAFAWIGLIDEETGAVEPVRQFGDRVGYVENIEVSIHAHEPAGMGPMGRAIRADELVVANHFQTAASTAAWHQPAIEAGVDAVAVFPIHRDGKVIGAMALYASTSDFFDESICRTVQELATDISFALDYFDRLEDLELAKEVVAASPAVLFRWKPTTGWPVEYVSENIERWGYQAEEWIEGMVPFIDYVHPDDVPRISEEVDTHIRHRHREFRQEYRLRMSDGRYRWFEDLTRFGFDSDGELTSITGALTDIDGRHQIEQHDRLMAMVIENTREGVVITDRDQVILEVNPAFTELTGYTAEEMIGKTPTMLSSGLHDEGFYRRMWKTLERDDHWQGEIWNRRKNGETFPEILSISAVTDHDGEITHYVGVFVDISRQKESESRLDFLAHYDPLTRLPNRPLLMERLEQLIDIARRKSGDVAVLMIDLDRFKDVNDSLGHAVGDQLLVKVSERLRERFGQADTIARMGGDEFALAITGIESAAEVGKLADQVINAMGEPWELGEGQQVRVLASVGISLYPQNADSPIGLAQQADTALYRAKDEGRGTFRFFSDEMTDAARDRVALELQLRQAIDNDELRLVYQPQTRLDDGGLHGAEALVRWQHPTEGLISPDRFIPVAETTGLIWPLGEWVLREACRQGQAWLDAGYEFGRLAVNVSPHQLRHGEVDRLVERVLAETGLPADRLELELTESAIIQRESEARELLDRLRTMGVHVALDDFGTGYSSLGHLREFAIDVLKIDKCFVDLIEEPSDRGQIARVIIDLGHTLDLKVLAEGVEHDSQLAFLRQYRCDIYQGYLESRPLAPDLFAQRYLDGGADGRSRP